MNSPNRFGEENVKPAKGTLEVTIISEDEFGMRREESPENPDWSHDPRSASAHESHTDLGDNVHAKPETTTSEELSLLLFLNPDVNAEEITVGFCSGVATLSGFVSSRTEKVEAERVVELAAGVKDVMNELQIRSKN